MKDPLGKALFKYHETGEEQKLKVFSQDVHTDVYKASYFFRDIEEMPELEIDALKMCKGRILDVGAGAGCHSIWLQNKGFDVTAIDTSAGAVDTMKARGVKNAINESIYDHNESYDTILMLMNGIGLSGKLRLVGNLLNKLKSLLNTGGQILTDSSDIFHLYNSLDSDDLLNLEKDYLGEVSFQFEYNGEKSDWFDWIYLDQRTFKEVATNSGFSFKIVATDSSKAYLAHLHL
ncbi:MAG: methyltransferase [Bacteroidia bacterium]